MSKRTTPPPATPRGLTDKGIAVHCHFTELRNAATIAAHAKNYRRHPQDQITRLVGLIKANGWRRPVVVSGLSGRIITGHGLVAAGTFMGDSVPVEVQQFADEAEESRHLVGDNRASHGGSDDEAALVELLRELEGLDPAGVGIPEAEFAELMKFSNEPPPPPAPAAPKAPAITYELVFDSKDQQERFHGFLRRLKKDLPSLSTHAARLDHFITRQPAE